MNNINQESMIVKPGEIHMDDDELMRHELAINND